MLAEPVTDSDLDFDLESEPESGFVSAPESGLEPDPEPEPEPEFESDPEPGLESDAGSAAGSEPVYTTELELRVLRGPQAGSRLALAVAEYTLGASDQCAIILAGPHIEGEHALLCFDGSNARIQPLDGSLSDAHGGQITAELTLMPGKQIELGGIWIAVDHPQAEWPEPQSVGTDSGKPASVEANLAPAEGPAPQGAPAGPVAVPSRRKTLIAIAAALTATVAAGAVLALAWPGRGGSAPPGPGTAQAQAASVSGLEQQAPKAVTEFLKTFDGGGRLAVTRDESGGWVVSGYVKSRAGRQALTDGLADVGRLVGVRVTVEEDVVDAANRFLAQRAGAAGGTLRTENAGDGTLRLVGTLPDEQALQALTHDLLAQVEGAREIRPEVLFAGQLRERLMGRIAEAGLAKELTVVQREPGIGLDGQAYRGANGGLGKVAGRIHPPIWRRAADTRQYRTADAEVAGGGASSGQRTYPLHHHQRGRAGEPRQQHPWIDPDFGQGWRSYFRRQPAFQTSEVIMTDPLFMLEIEQKMYADTSGEFRKGMLQRLLVLRGSLELRLRQLNDPKTFLGIKAAAQAVDAAIHALRSIRVNRSRQVADQVGKH